MTPKRKAYWKKCSLKERTLRALINDEKCAIKVLKNNFKYPENYNFNILLIMISQCKVRLFAYRHELQRLKGMDRVVVPICSFCLDVEEGNIVDYEVCYCRKCGAIVGGDLSERCDYCPNCGRRILWEKVSK